MQNKHKTPPPQTNIIYYFCQEPVGFSSNETMIKKMRNWYTKAKFEKNDAGCTLELGHSLDLVLTINNRHRMPPFGELKELDYIRRLRGLCFAF